jgi:predicted RND superfamily exporter protein
MGILIGIILSIIIGGIIIVFILWVTRKKSPKVKESSTQSTPAKGDTNPPSTGNATPSKKQGMFAKIANIIGFIILLVVVIVIVVWSIGFVSRTIKSIFQSSPKYSTVLVEVRKKTINLNNEYNDVDTINIQYGQKFKFKNATVSFCARNSVYEEVCGPAFSDPDLPSGKANENVWFKNKNGNTGTIQVVVYERQKRLIQ